MTAITIIRSGISPLSDAVLFSINFSELRSRVDVNPFLLYSCMCDKLWLLTCVL